MKFSLRGASGVALLFGLTGVAGAQTVSTTQTTPATTATTTTTAATPQTTPAPAASTTTQDKVTITGSLIASTPEDAPRPVDVITSQDLKEQGDPNINEFIKGLTTATPNAASTATFTSGTAAIGAGFVNIDIAGQGSNGTLVLMNGRRLASTNGGAGADVQTIPMAALEAVEVLKSGASTTYGAGAVGGVVNFRTRRDISRPEVRLSKNFYNGGSNWESTLLNGWVGDAGNVLLSWTHFEEGRLPGTARDFSTLPFVVNPEGYQLANGNLTNRFHRVTNAGNSATPLTTTQTFSGSFSEFGSPATTPGGTGLNDTTSCGVYGGLRPADVYGPTGNSGTAFTNAGTAITNADSCGYRWADWSDLVGETRRDQAYIEVNTDITDNMEFHFDFTYSTNDAHSRRYPIGSPQNRTIDPGSSIGNCATSCFLSIPAAVTTYTNPGATAGQAGTDGDGAPTGSFVVNPFIAQFNSYLASHGGAANQVNGVNEALYVSSNWRPFFWGGNPNTDDGLGLTNVTRERDVANIGFKGTFVEGDNFLGKLLNGITYDIAGQFNQYVETRVENGGIITERLQAALQGYGGVDCNAVDRVRTDYSTTSSYNRTIGIQSDTAAGTKGCQWYNPFLSNFETALLTGNRNPLFPTGSTTPTWAVNGTQNTPDNQGPQGFKNDPALEAWMWSKRRTEVQYQSSTFDATFTGSVPDSIFALPGGEIGWAAGLQWRQTERRAALQEEDAAKRVLLQQRCPYGQVPAVTNPQNNTTTTRGCTSGTGATLADVTTLTNASMEDFINSQTIAYYAEVSLPVLDNLSLSANVRREDFNGGDIVGDIWGVAGKYNFTEELYLRGSYSTNFRAQGILDATPGSITNGFTTSGTGSFASLLFAPTGATSFNLQTLVDPNITPEEDEDLNIGVGFQTRDFLGGRLRLSADYRHIIVSKDVNTTTGNSVISSVFSLTSPGAGSLAIQANCASPFISFINFNSGACQQGITTAADINFVTAIQTNGGGQDTIYMDYSASYVHPFLGGDLSVSANLTEYLKFYVKDFVFNNVTFEAGGDRRGYRNTTVSPNQKVRGNLSVRWFNDEHNIGMRILQAGGYIPGLAETYVDIDPKTTGTQTSTLGVEHKRFTTYDLTYIFTPKAIKDLEFKISVLNLTDRIPLLQTTAGFDPRLGDPRGRTVEIGFTKKF